MKTFNSCLAGAILLLFISLSISSCVKKGCTDSTAINYDSKATRSDSSCIYATPPPGQFVFWSAITDSVDRIDVTINGSTGSITLQKTTAPDCNTIGCFTIPEPAGVYTYTAVGIGGGTWSGSVTIPSVGGCVRVKIQ